ncbi:hypothetical protein ACFLT1_09025 [Bacteroidota bacterium]
MRKIVGILLLFLVVSSCDRGISEFQSRNFIKYFGNGYESLGKDLLELSDGSFVLTGMDETAVEDYQVYAAKVDAKGNLEWEQTYTSTAVIKEGRVIRQVADGFIIGGVTLGDTIHSFILKISSTGDSLWYKEIGDPDLDIELKDMTIYNNQIIVVGSIIWSGDTDTDFYITGLSMDAEEEWTAARSFGSSGSAIKKVFIEGNSIHCFGDYGVANTLAWIKYNSSGGNLDAKFELSSTVEGEIILEAVQLEDGYLVLTNNAAGTASTLYRFSSAVVKQWSTSIETMVGKAFASTTDASIVVIGETIDLGKKAAEQHDQGKC